MSIASVREALLNADYLNIKSILKKETIENSDLDQIGLVIEKDIERKGDTDPYVAPSHLVYGSACLRYVQQNLDVLGSKNPQMMASQNKAAASSSSSSSIAIAADPSVSEKEEQDITASDAAIAASLQHEEEDGEYEGEEEDGDGQERLVTEDELNDLLQISWECLDLSRALYRKVYDEIEPQHNEKDNDQIEKGGDLELIIQLLGDAHIQLGDLSLEMGNFNQSVEDYKEGLRLRNIVYPLGSRKIADAHAQLGVANRYIADEPSTTDATTFRLLSLTHYVEAARSLREYLVDTIQSPSSSSSSSSASAALFDLQKNTLPSLNPENTVEDAKQFVSTLRKDLEIALKSPNQEIRELADIIESVCIEIDDGITAIANPEQAAIKTKEMIMKIVGGAMKGSSEGETESSIGENFEAAPSSTTTTGFDKTSSAAQQAATILQPRKKAANSSETQDSSKQQSKRDRDDESGEKIKSEGEDETGNGDQQEGETDKKKQRVE